MVYTAMLIIYRSLSKIANEDWKPYFDSLWKNIGRRKIRKLCNNHIVSCCLLGKRLNLFADEDFTEPSIQKIISICDVFNVMDNIREYQLYLEALDENKSAFERRNAIKRLYECRTEESLYYLNEIIVDRDGLVPDWIKKIAREYYVDLCLEYL